MAETCGLVRIQGERLADQIQVLQILSKAFDVHVLALRETVASQIGNQYSPARGHGDFSEGEIASTMFGRAMYNEERALRIHRGARWRRIRQAFTNEQAHAIGRRQLMLAALHGRPLLRGQQFDQGLPQVVATQVHLDDFSLAVDDDQCGD